MIKNKKSLLIIVSTIIIVIFCLVICYFVFLKDKNKKGSENLTVEEKKAILGDLKATSKEVTATKAEKMEDLKNLEDTSKKELPSIDERKILLESLRNQ